MIFAQTQIVNRKRIPFYLDIVWEYLRNIELKTTMDSNMALRFK